VQVGGVNASGCGAGEECAPGGPMTPEAVHVLIAGVSELSWRPCAPAETALKAAGEDDAEQSWPNQG
jgi:hypothetical protein